MADPFDQASKMFEKSVGVASEVFDRSMDAASRVFDKSMDVASEAFDKGKDVTSGVADSAADFAKRGKVRAQLADVNIEYERLMRKLGTVVYEQIRDDAKYVDAHPDLFGQIEKLVQRRQDLEDQLSASEAADDAAEPVDVEVIDAEVIDAEVEEVPVEEEKAEDAE